MAEAPARLIWSLTAAVLATGTTITASGNSGTYSAAAPNARTTVDLRWTDDIWLSVYATGGAGTSLIVNLDGYDDQGNLFTALASTPALTSAPGGKVVSAGRHAPSTYLVLPEWGRISWTQAGTFTGAEICLYGRG